MNVTWLIKQIWHDIEFFIKFIQNKNISREVDAMI
jgi:hypothetical protein